MAWFWARAYKRTASLGTFVGGFQVFLEALAEEVIKQGARLRLGVPVQEIAPKPGGGFTVRLDDGVLDADQVLSTASPRLMARLAPALPEEYRAQLERLQSLGAVALILALDRQLMTDGTYWLNLPANSPDKNQNAFPFLALVEHTNYVSAEYFGGDHLVYLGDYLPADHEYFRLSEDELADRFLPALVKVNPDFSPDWVRKRWLFRSPYAQPVPTINHSQNIPPVRTPLPGLYLACMSQVYPWDRGTNYAVAIGRRAARMMLADQAG
jgi:protoporphyrinogen oxidase